MNRTEEAAAQTILHMAPSAAWAAAKSTRQTEDQSTDDPEEIVYRDPSLDAEGFIHCSTREQVLIPANERFAGRDDLVLLVIDPALVPSPTVFEDCYDSGQAFPHIYGPIPVAAVIDVVPFPCEADGTFTLPDQLT